MSETPNNSALEEILLKYNLSPVAFHKLRSDSYERILASHSLEQLDLFYAVLLNPELSNTERAEQAPFWPPGSERSGEPPSEYVVRTARQRMFQERSLNNLDQVSDFMERMRDKLAIKSAGNQAEVLDRLLDIMGEEMLMAKLDGADVKDSKDVAELLLYARAAKDKAAAENVKLALKKQEADRKERELALNLEKHQRETCVLFLKWHKDIRAREIAESNITNEEKIKQLRLTFFADVDALEQSGSVQLPPIT